MGASPKPRTWLALLLLLCLGPGKRRAGSSAPPVNCICFNGDYMTCDWGSEDKPMAAFSFYYWFDDEKPVECQDYLQKDGIPVGCRLNVTLEDRVLSMYLHIYTNSSHTTASYNSTVELLSLVKVGTPFNLSVETLDNNQLRLSWKTPFRSPGCLEHLVKYKSNKDAKWTEQKTERLVYSVISVDPGKRYTFLVHSKLKNTCGTTKLWSDPGGPVFWGKDTPEPSMPLALQVGLSLAALFLLILLVLTLLHMERVRLVLMPAIPNPSKKFEDLFTAYHGNFSEWAGVSKDAVETFKPSYCESICRITELFPGGGYLPISMDAGGKAAGVPGASTANVV